MTKPNPVQAAPASTDLRQRAARARDAAGRFIKRAPATEILPAEAKAPETDALPPEQALADAIDLADVPLATLLAVHDVADMLSAVAAAATCQPRCYDDSRDRVDNAAGRLANWITDACSHVAEAAIAEARRRDARSRPEAVTRLAIVSRCDVVGGTDTELSHLVADIAALSADQVGH